jgi:hypothetical protein
MKDAPAAFIIGGRAASSAEERPAVRDGETERVETW